MMPVDVGGVKVLVQSTASRSDITLLLLRCAGGLADSDPRESGDSLKICTLPVYIMRQKF